MDQPSFSESFTRKSLFALLVLSPVPIGLAESWSLGLFELLIGSLLLFWLTASWLRGSFTVKPSPLYLPIACILIYSFLRLIPLGTIPLPGENHFFSFRSLIPPATLNEVQLLLAASVVFFLLANLSRPQDLRTFAIVLLVAATGYSLFGLVQHNLSEYLLLGFRRPRIHFGNLSGTYVNPDHFAPLLELIIPLGFGLLMFVTPRSQIPKPDDNFLGRVRQRLSQGEEHSSAQYLLISFLLIALVTSIIFTASRSGIVAGLTGIVFFIFRVRTGSPKKRRPWVIIPILTFALFAGLWIGMKPIFEKFSRTEAQLSSLNGRVPYWETGMIIFSRHPLFGTGPGTTRWVYPRYRDPDTPDSLQVNHLHNDYLETLTENGLVGFGLFIWLLASYLRIYLSPPALSRTRSRRRSRVHLLIPAYQAGMVAFLLHAGVDFIFRIPANLFLFTSFVALTSRGPEFQSGILTDSRPAPSRPRSPILLIGAIAGILLITGSLRLGLGGIFYRSLDRDVRRFLRSTQLIPPRDVDLHQGWRVLKRAVRFDPIHPQYRAELGQVLIRLSAAYSDLHTGWGARRGGEMLRADAIRQFERAVVLNPYEPRSRISLAYLIFPPADPGNPDRERAYSLFHSARELNPAHGKNALAIGEFYLQYWDTLNPDERELMIDSLRTGFHRNPRVFPATLTRAWFRIGDYAIVQRLIPHTQWFHTQAIKVFLRLGDKEAAASERGLLNTPSPPQ